MLTKAQNKFIYDKLVGVVTKGDPKPKSETYNGRTWYITDYVAFSNAAEHGTGIFNSEMFEPIEILDHLSKDLSVAEPVAVTGGLLETVNKGKKVTVQKFVTESGKTIWLDKKLVKLLPPNTHEYKALYEKYIVYCLKGDELRGIIMSYRVKEEDLA